MKNDIEKRRKRAGEEKERRRKGDREKMKIPKRKGDIDSNMWLL